MKLKTLNNYFNLGKSLFIAGIFFYLLDLIITSFYFKYEGNPLINHYSLLTFIIIKSLIFIFLILAYKPTVNSLNELTELNIYSNKILIVLFFIVAFVFGVFYFAVFFHNIYFIMNL